MNKLLLAICFLISTSTIASYPDGNFITKEVGRLKMLTNEKQDSGYLFVSIFGPFGSSILSDGCSGLCYFLSTKTHTPKIDGFDGILWTEEEAARGDGRWIESTGGVSIYTKDTPHILHTRTTEWVYRNHTKHCWFDWLWQLYFVFNRYQNRCCWCEETKLGWKWVEYHY